MDPAYISAIAGLMGAIIGGTTSFVTTWLTQRAQLREKHREALRAARETLFSDFIAESSRVWGDALTHEKDDVTDLVRLYTLAGQIRLVASPAVVEATKNAMDTIIETYLSPNLSLHEVYALAKQGGLTFLVAFVDACREDLKRV